MPLSSFCNSAACASILRGAGFGADTVGQEELSGAEDAVIATTSRSEDRILLTLDLDFANIRAYPPGEHAGMIILRMKQQDKAPGPVNRLEEESQAKSQSRPDNKETR